MVLYKMGNSVEELYFINTSFCLLSLILYTLLLPSLE